MTASDPLHGVTLKALLETLVERYGWEGLGERVPVRCFLNEPSLPSSLKFLRKTPWAREKVEALYVSDVRKAERNRRRNRRRKERREYVASIPVERDDTLAFTWPLNTEAPPVELPEGYTLRSAIDPEAFEAVQHRIGFTPSGPVEVVPDGTMFVCDADGPVAVACAEPREADWVELSWVAVDPEHRGRGLGRAVCSELVRVLLDQGRDRIVCSTLDDRIHALRIYLDMGFRPVMREGKEARWGAVRGES